MMEKRELSEEYIRQFVSEVREASRTGDIDKVLPFIAADVELEDVALSQTYHGKEEVRSYIHMFLTAFSGLDISLSNYLVSGDWAIVEGTIKGTHTGPFLGYAPTGRQIEFKTCRIFSLRDGLIYRGRAYYDLATILRQIGALEERLAA